MFAGRLLFGISWLVIVLALLGLGLFFSGISVLLGFWFLLLGFSWLSLLSQRTFFFDFARMPNRLF